MNLDIYNETSSSMDVSYNGTKQTLDTFAYVAMSYTSGDVLITSNGTTYTLLESGIKSISTYEHTYRIYDTINFANKTMTTGSTTYNLSGVHSNRAVVLSFNSKIVTSNYTTGVDSATWLQLDYSTFISEPESNSEPKSDPVTATIKKMPTWVLVAIIMLIVVAVLGGGAFVAYKYYGH
jgi:hypothetical protein